MGDFARQFEGVTEHDVEEMMDSFRFGRCRRRTRLEDVLGRFANRGCLLMGERP